MITIKRNENGHIVVDVNVRPLGKWYEEVKILEGRGIECSSRAISIIKEITLEGSVYRKAPRTWMSWRKQVCSDICPVIVFPSEDVIPLMGRHATRGDAHEYAMRELGYRRLPGINIMLFFMQQIPDEMLGARKRYLSTDAGIERCIHHPWAESYQARVTFDLYERYLDREIDLGLRFGAGPGPGRNLLYTQGT